MVKDKEVTVAALMTAPRYECVQCRNQIEHSLNAIGIPLTISQGVYYGQCMQSMMEEVLAEGSINYILTVDFDSIFIEKHVQRLLNIITQEDQIDALAAIQPMRGLGRVLASVTKAKDIEWDGSPIPVETAHFGLTVIRTDKLAEMQKPWFWAVPDESGSWNEGCIDADVSFWRSWQKAGNSLYIDPGTRLGHMEELVTVFDKEMKPQHMYYKAWQAKAEETVD